MLMRGLLSGKAGRKLFSCQKKKRLRTHSGLLLQQARKKKIRIHGDCWVINMTISNIKWDHTIRCLLYKKKKIFGSFFSQKKKRNNIKFLKKNEEISKILFYSCLNGFINWTYSKKCVMIIKSFFFLSYYVFKPS